MAKKKVDPAAMTFLEATQGGRKLPIGTVESPAPVVAASVAPPPVPLPAPIIAPPLPIPVPVAISPKVEEKKYVAVEAGILPAKVTPVAMKVDDTGSVPGSHPIRPPIVGTPVVQTAAPAPVMPETSGYLKAVGDPKTFLPVAPTDDENEHEQHEGDEEVEFEVDEPADLIGQAVSAANGNIPIPQKLPPVPVPQAEAGATQLLPVQEQKKAEPAAINNNEVAWLRSVQAEIETLISQTKYLLGLSIFDNPDPKSLDPKNILHRIIHRLRWQPNTVVQFGPHDLCAMEHALSAHQVKVQSLENEWHVRFNFLGEEYGRVMRSRRDGYSGKTRQEQEEVCLSKEPEVKNLYREYLIAKAMAKFLENQGSRFAQFEDSIKRTSSLRQYEYQRGMIQAGRTT